MIPRGVTTATLGLVSTVSAAVVAVQADGLSDTGWLVIGALALGALAMMKGFIEAGMGKYILYLLRKEKATFAAFVVDDVLDERGKEIREALRLATKHELELIELIICVEKNCAAITVVQTHTQGLERLPAALEALAKSFEGQVQSFARMEEREKMRDKWDEQTERRKEIRRGEDKSRS